MIIEVIHSGVENGPKIRLIMENGRRRGDYQNGAFGVFKADIVVATSVAIGDKLWRTVIRKR